MARRLDDLSPIPASQITPKEVFLDRRRFLAAAAATAAAGLGVAGEARAEDIAIKLPAPRNTALSVGDAPTTKKIITTYNNFYEFGMGKTDPAASASAMKIRPWTIQIGGAVEKPMTLGIEDILKMPLEERVYRFRCVEAWSMVVPWIGIEFNKIAALVSPTSNAKYVEVHDGYAARDDAGRSRAGHRFPLCRGPAHRRGHASPGAAHRRPLRRDAAQPERRARAHDRALEIRLQERESPSCESTSSRSSRHPPG